MVKAIQEVEEKKKTKKEIEMEIEFQRLKALVKIPYLPPLFKSFDDRPIYTLVLDLDETLIHLECDEEAEEG
jgi:predicted HAD superfamily phosphohydrolase YqeG